MKRQDLVPWKTSEGGQPQSDSNIGGEEAGVDKNTGPGALRYGFKLQLYCLLWKSHRTPSAKRQWHTLAQQGPSETHRDKM